MDFHTFDFRLAGALKIVSPFSDIWLLFAHSQLRLIPAYETQGARGDTGRATRYTPKQTRGSARFLKFHFPDMYGNGRKFVDFLDLRLKLYSTDSQRLNRCIDRFLVILNRFRGPRINSVASVLIQSDTDLYR